MSRLSRVTPVLSAIGVILLIYWFLSIRKDISFQLKKADDKNTLRVQNIVWGTVNSTEFHLNPIPRLAWLLHASEDAYQRYVENRKSILGSSTTFTNPSQTTTTFYDYFFPTFSCPHTLQRIGRLGKGGRYVCGLELLQQPPNCIVYSFGVSGDFSMEAEFLNRSRCIVYTYDLSINTTGTEIPLEGNRLHLQSTLAEVGKGQKTKTLGTIIRENGHTWIDVLKLTIAEAPVLNQILDEFNGTLPVGQLLLEIQGLQNTPFQDFNRLWERLENAGLRPFMIEGNHSSPFHVNCAFINIKATHRLVM